jgi:hypothetical protein
METIVKIEKMINPFTEWYVLTDPKDSSKNVVTLGQISELFLKNDNIRVTTISENQHHIDITVETKIKCISCLLEKHNHFGEEFIDAIFYHLGHLLHQWEEE